MIVQKTTVLLQNTNFELLLTHIYRTGAIIMGYALLAEIEKLFKEAEKNKDKSKDNCENKTENKPQEH